MAIAFLTAASLARPLHSLQRWWQQLHPRSLGLGHAAWLQDGKGAAQHGASAVSVLTLRRARGRAALASAQEGAPGPASRGLAVPAPWRTQDRGLAQGTGEIRLNAPARRAFQRTTPSSSSLSSPSSSSLRVLHRPTSLARPGGLVIAGRMADVCAELDRLVAMEALH